MSDKEYDQRADYEFFRGQLPVLLKTMPGKVVLINRQTIVGHFDTMNAAIVEGAERFGAGNFIAQDVEDDDQTLVSVSLAY